MNKQATMAIIVVLAAGVVFAADFWEEKPYKEWSEEQVQEMMSDSPWSWIKKTSIFTSAGGGVAGRGNRQRTEVQYFVRLRSSKPIRMALARYSQIYAGWTDQQADAYVERMPYDGEIVIAAASAPAGVVATPLENPEMEKLKKETYLKLGDEKLEFEKYIPPSESGTQEALFLFPRPSTLPQGAKELEFRTKVEGVELKAKFKFKDIQFEGSPEF